MELDHTPYSFVPMLKFPLEIERRLRPFCEHIALRDDIPEGFYLAVLCSLSLSMLEKHRVFLNLPELSIKQIEDLDEVLRDEVREFDKLYKTEGEIILGLILKMLLNMITLLRMYQIFEPAEEKTIFNQIFTQWLKNDKEQEKIVFQKIQQDNRLFKYLHEYCTQP